MPTSIVSETSASLPTSSYNHVELPEETQQVFSQDNATYSLNYRPYTDEKRDDSRSEYRDIGVGKNLREAIAIVKDWSK